MEFQWVSLSCQSERGRSFRKKAWPVLFLPDADMAVEVSFDTYCTGHMLDRYVSRGANYSRGHDG